VISWGEIAVESDTSLQEKCNSDVMVYQAKKGENETIFVIYYLLTAGERGEAVADSG
jgi:TfoX/Sxy family transcriptional regulator of competence genes